MTTGASDTTGTVASAGPAGTGAGADFKGDAGVDEALGTTGVLTGVTGVSTLATSFGLGPNRSGIKVGKKVSNFSQVKSKIGVVLESGGTGADKVKIPAVSMTKSMFFKDSGTASASKSDVAALMKFSIKSKMVNQRA